MDGERGQTDTARLASGEVPVPARDGCTCLQALLPGCVFVNKSMCVVVWHHPHKRKRRLIPTGIAGG